ncbi:MAG: Ig-like domain-containing protein [Prolixibacteraceae bacterium]|nr:Ig-like domain-containing protein [Prolixibacteraceae bacterium]
MRRIITLYRGKKHILRLFIFCCLLLSACEKDEIINTGPQTIKIIPPKEECWVSDSFLMEAIFDEQKNSTQTVVWSSSNENLATIDNSGMVTLKKEGQVKINAQSGKLSATYNMTIKPMNLLYQTTGQKVNAIKSMNWSDRKTEVLLNGTWAFSTPKMAPDGSALVFADTISYYNPDIFVYQFDQSKRIHVAGYDDWDDQPIWDTSSKRIIFRSFRNNGLGCIYEYDLSNSSLVNLTPDPVNAAWVNLDPALSPDGMKMAFSNNKNGIHDIWIYDFDSKTMSAVTATMEYEGEPAWSPDSKKLVFRRDFSFHPKVSDLFILDLEKNTTQQLSIEGVERQPAWSPNGKFIVFTYQPGNSLPVISYIDVEKPEEVFILEGHYGYSPSFY